MIFCGRNCLESREIYLATVNCRDNFFPRKFLPLKYNSINEKTNTTSLIIGVLPTTINDVYDIAVENGHKECVNYIKSKLLSQK